MSNELTATVVGTFTGTRQGEAREVASAVPTTLSGIVSVVATTIGVHSEINRVSVAMTGDQEN